MPGVDGTIEIRRDRFGVPYINAGSDHDAAYGIGFCHGQDRSFQLEALLRTARGTLAEVFGESVVEIDRLTRRIGFGRLGAAQIEYLTDDQRSFIEGYASGVNAGRQFGTDKPQHEFALLRTSPTPFAASDAPAILALMSFFLASNWEAELARLLILVNDGPEALEAIEPDYPSWHHVSSPPGATAGVVQRLAIDLEALSEWVGMEGASNAWAVSGDLTESGRPILSNDPHLGPLVPPHWYLCRVATPDWAMAGATFVGGPTMASGHNGHAAWGVTAGLADNSDLFIERIADGRVAEPNGTSEPTVVREVIAVRDGDTIVEDVVVTSRGPVIGPALGGGIESISLSATWLRPGPMDGLFSLHRVHSFEEFRAAFANWPGPSFGYVYADADGTVGYSLVGDVPQRASGGAAPLPQAAWDPGSAWLKSTVPEDAKPHTVNPEAGWVAAANSRPGVDLDPNFGHDFLDGYRLGRIVEILSEDRKWDVASFLSAQLDQRSRQWDDIREAVLDAIADVEDLADAAHELRDWGGVLAADSSTATLFELLWAELDHRVVTAKAPQAGRWALGQGFSPISPFGLLGFRRGSRIADLLRTQPDSYFEDGWRRVIAEAVRVAEARRAELDDARWGHARPLVLRHLFSERPPLDRVFNLGPIHLGGDGSSVNQAGTSPLDPLDEATLAIASLRTVVDVGDWDRSRYVLPGGQSGNPLSPHYSDQLSLWSKGDGIPIAWSEELIADITRHTLTLKPEIRGSDA